MLVTPSGMVIEVKPDAFSNALVSMLVKFELESNITVAKLVVPWNAPNPMLSTLSGMVTEVKLDAFLNAYQPMLVTPSGMVIEVKLDAS